MNNRKKITQLILIIVALTLLILVIFLLFYHKKLINNSNHKKENVELLWKSYDKHIENIKSNMDEIAIPTKEESTNGIDFYWQELKDFSIEDETYFRNLNELTVNIRMCYLEFTQGDDNYAKSNPILKYRDTKKMTTNEVEQLRRLMQDEYNNNCFDNLRSYNNIMLSSDSKTEERFKNKINNILEMRKNDIFEYEEGTRIYKKKNVTFNELLFYKNMEVALIDELSTWLRSEYYRLK